ncbi:MAG: 4-alpha-glucanotransferase, partial [Clostridiales Family XIII bacterium]|nr:4-alpha-glucanotransferase [Clostridiales Family XIII bacterium]
PWGREDPDILAWYRLLGNLRSEYELFRIGNFESFACDGNIYGFSRSTAGERVVVLLNPSKDQDEKTTLTVADGEEVILELLSGAALDAGEAAPDEKRLLNLSLNRLEAKMIYFKKAEPSSFPMKNLPRMSGVLCHISSLPSEWGCGGFGQESYDFCDYLAAAGQGLWQILPLNPVGAGNSPYSSCSVFAGNELFVDCALLARDGLLKPGDCRPADAGTNSSPAREKLYGKNSDFERARKNKLPLFRKAFAAFDQNDPEYLDFCGENEEWLADYCLYRAISEKQKGRPWQEWPAGLRERDDGALAKARARLEESIAYHRFIQYEFSRQWKQLKERANRRGVRILGDIPFYVSAESADAWSNRSLFALDARGASEKNSGVPPDPFCPQGQNWKMPVYLWDNHKNLGYAWWIRRMRRGAELHDYLRLDHFRGFDAFWQIPGGEETAVNGYWVKGPGKAFFEALEAALGPLPILAENLGFLTPGVANLKNTFSWPGISVYQFESDEFENEKTPNADRMRALYTGTHDNDTLAGWLRERNPSMTRREIKSECRRILRRLYADDAMWVLSPLQDVFALDSRARMNTPGLAEGNWTWAAPRNAFSPESARFLRGLAEEFRRNASPV